ncbi:hypothetical protein [Paludisphaera sp.]|uniref:hypothetical protein n=1 Tax=Paludisphaera sp. TaxID=2017432 RepID=UPI00301B7394
MRGRGREVLVILVVAAAATLPNAAAPARAQSPPPPPSVMTVELEWNLAVPGDHAPTLEPPSQDVMLEVVGGRVVEGVAWPWDADAKSHPGPAADGAWRLGSEARGKVRARIEAGPGSELIVRRGDQSARLDVASLLEGEPTMPAAGLGLVARRLPWDVLAVDFGPGAEGGVAAPGATVPVTIGYNIIQADAAEATVRTTAVLRLAGRRENVWEFEQREVLPTNRPDPPARLWSIPAPEKEGTYVLEIQATWESTPPREGSRIGRLIRRRKAPGAVGTSSRRVALVVLGTQSPGAPAMLGGEPGPRETEVDSLDLGRIRSARFSTWGRSPTTPGGSAWDLPSQLLADPARREKEREWLRGFISKAGSEPARIAKADGSTLAWSAVSLRCARPGRPHRLVVTATAGDPASIGAVLVDPGTSERRPRIALDACGGSSSGGDGSMEWIVWPGSAEPILVLLNRDAEADATIGSIRLVELEAPTGVAAPYKPDGRSVGLHLAGPDPLARFAVDAEPGIVDPMATAENLASYMATCGATFVVVREAPSARGFRRRLAGRLVEDATGPEPIDVSLRVLKRHGLSAWVEPDLGRPDALPGLPPAGSEEAATRGLVLVGADGKPDGSAYQPLHPKVREALRRRVVDVLAGPGGYSGVLIRLGDGPTLLGTPDTGLDDVTFERFVRETFGPDVAREVPGLDTSDAGRHEARAKYVAGVGRMPWLSWRSKAVAALYEELAAAAREAAPGSVLAVATPTLDDGPAGSEARRVDMAGLAPNHAWRALGLDLDEWRTGPDAPVVLRGASLSGEGLARDLAGHPDLDSRLARFDRRGFLLLGDPTKGDAPRASALSPGDGATDDAPLAHAVAALDARWLVVAETAASGREDRLRRFADVFRRLPPSQGALADPASSAKDAGVAVRTFQDQGGALIAMVNDTPYTMRLAGVLKGDPKAVVEDLGRGVKLAPQSVDGGRRLVVDVAPFGLSVVRVAGDSSLDGAKLYPPEAAIATMEEQSRALSERLATLNQGGGSPIVEPPNAGFEQEPVTPAAMGEPGKAAPGGWRVDPASRSAELAIDEKDPHSGGRCLRLDAVDAPAAVVSGDFEPGAGGGLMVQAYLRGDKEGASVRVWVEGEAEGKTFARRAEFTATTEWKPVLVRVADLPHGGLDVARLRFEATAPGSLWVDDVRVRAEAAPKAVRLNAQRTLLAALQAFRERRYAEFARLAESHWARHPGVLALVRGERARREAAGGPEAAEASALPPDRALR